jgi:hypothetical protein
MPPLPFKDVAAVLHGAGDVTVAALACSLWPLANPRTTAGGETYDWMGEAERAAYDELAKTNRSIKTSEGRYLKIISATPHDFLPHVALQLRETRAGG